MRDKGKFDQLERYGFGPNVMKKTCVCPSCGSLAKSSSVHCPECGGRLSGGTLFDTYKEKHPACSHCDTVLTADAQYCPECGRPVVRRQDSRN